MAKQSNTVFVVPTTCNHVILCELTRAKGFLTLQLGVASVTLVPNLPVKLGVTSVTLVGISITSVMLANTAKTTITGVSAAVIVSVTAGHITAWLGITSVNLSVTTGTRVTAVSNAPVTLDSLGKTRQDQVVHHFNRRQKRYRT